MEFSESERMVLENLIHWRRDVRGHQFIDQPIPQEVQDRILTAGIKAPSVGYSQPARFITVNNPETKAKIRNITPAQVHECLDAGNVVIVAGFQGQTPDGNSHLGQLDTHTYDIYTH